MNGCDSYGEDMSNYIEIIGLKDNYEQRNVECEVCGHLEFTSIIDKGRIGGPGIYGELPIKGCNQCGYIMLNPVWEEQLYIDYYKNKYRKVTMGDILPSDEYIDRQKFRGGKILEYITQFLPKPSKMLDLGCSVGAMMHAFVNGGWEVTGVDPDENSVAMGKKIFGYNLMQGDAETLSIEDEKFDFIMLSTTIEHFYDLHQSMSAVRKILNNDGVLLFSYRSDQIWGSIFEYFNHNHFRYFSKETIKLLMIRLGFEIIEFNDNAIEEVPGTAYVLVKRGKDGNKDAVLKAIEKGVKDDVTLRKEDILSHQNAFVQRSKKLLETIEENNGDYEIVANEIRTGEYNFVILDGPPVEALERAVLEAEKAIAISTRP